jgi:hypothetical protein
MMTMGRSGAKGRRVGRGRVLAACVCAAGMVTLVMGCGGQQDQASGSSGSGQSLVVAQASTPVETARGTGQAQPAVAQGEGIAAASADSLSPDVAVTVADTLVFPGSAVEIKAEGSPDVVGVTLSDGVGRKQPFTYDASTDTWKVFYRVPMKSRTERLALSVTARNAPERWRRVWVFLSVQHEGAGAAPDSSAKP